LFIFQNRHMILFFVLLFTLPWTNVAIVPAEHGNLTWSLVKFGWGSGFLCFSNSWGNVNTNVFSATLLVSTSTTLSKKKHVSDLDIIALNCCHRCFVFSSRPCDSVVLLWTERIWSNSVTFCKIIKTFSVQNKKIIYENRHRVLEGSKAYNVIILRICVIEISSRQCWDNKLFMSR